MKSHPKSQDFYCEWLGLEPGPRPPDHYTLLGIERFEAEVTRIEDAARDRVKLVRPLCTKFPEEGTRILNEVTQAKLCLVDGELRSEYDRTLKNPPPTVDSVDTRGQAEAGASKCDSNTTSRDSTPDKDTNTDAGKSATYDDDEWDDLIADDDRKWIDHKIAESESVSAEYAGSLDWLQHDPVDEIDSAGVATEEERDAIRGAVKRSRKIGRFCPHCGKRMFPQEKVCHACRNDLGDRTAWLTARCQLCDAPLGQGAVSCKSCGADFALDSLLGPPLSTRSGGVPPFACSRNQTSRISRKGTPDIPAPARRKGRVLEYDDAAEKAVDKDQIENESEIEDKGANPERSSVQKSGVTGVANKTLIRMALPGIFAEISAAANLAGMAAFVFCDACR